MSVLPGNAVRFVIPFINYIDQTEFDGSAFDIILKIYVHRPFLAYYIEELYVISFFQMLELLYSFHGISLSIYLGFVYIRQLLSLAFNVP